MTDAPDELHTPLHDRHVALDARMGLEAGWRVPLSYRGALDEADALRRRAGAADVSSGGRLRVRGDGALELLERVCACDVARQEDDTAQPAPICNDRGGLLDLCLLVRLADEWWLLTSPPCREKLLSHLQPLAEELGAKVADRTAKTAAVEVAGPRAAAILDAVLPEPVSPLPAGAARSDTLLLARYVAVRTDGTGEWGLRVILPAMIAGRAWDFVTTRAGENCVEPVGLATLDVLRVEAGVPRYGCELNETIDPLTAGLGEHVDFGHEFIGREALERIARGGPRRRLAGLVVEASGSPPAAGSIAKAGSRVLRADGGEVGTVTSGTYSPALERAIALAYVAPGVEEGDAVRVETDAPQPARVTALPFVSRAEK